jgi:RNA polymerase sigma factor (TIGR02999 family)
MPQDPQKITLLLKAWRCGDQSAGDALISIVYPELKRLASHSLRRQRRGHTLQPTALVHELFISLLASNPISWHDRGHFFVVAARQFRRILIDYARAAHAAKRGGNQARVTLDDFPKPGPNNDDLLAIDEALTRLEQLDQRAARVVELRFFAGFREQEAADALDVSVATVKRDWEFARAWLSKQLAVEPDNGTSRAASSP